MAQKVNIVLVDDIDGNEADETVSFALDGKNYEIDLTEKNATKLRNALAPFVGNARRGAVRGRRGRGAASAGASATEVRAWARDNNYEVSERGRVPADIREAYEAAH